MATRKAAIIKVRIAKLLKCILRISQTSCNLDRLITISIRLVSFKAYAKSAFPKKTTSGDASKSKIIVAIVPKFSLIVRSAEPG